MEGKYCLCVSNEILNEYQEIIERYSSATIASNIIKAIVHSPYTVYNESFYRFNLIESDPDDNKFVDCAICSNAEFIVTEDSHFNVLKDIPFPKVKVISLDQFLTEL